MEGRGRGRAAVVRGEFSAVDSPHPRLINLAEVIWLQLAETEIGSVSLASTHTHTLIVPLFSGSMAGRSFGVCLCVMSVRDTSYGAT